MVLLNETLLISQGLHRACYRHPTILNRCIKVHLEEGNDRETIREIKYYQHISNKVFSERVISQYYGMAQTNLGAGYIFELIKDYNGEVSKTLLHYLSDNSLYSKHKANLEDAYQRMKTLVNQYALVTMKLKPYNILYQLRNQDEGDLIIIDNLGCANLLPLAYYSNYFARKKLSRRFDSFEKMLKTDLGISLTKKENCFCNG